MGGECGFWDFWKYRDLEVDGLAWLQTVPGDVSYKTNILGGFFDTLRDEWKSSEPGPLQYFGFALQSLQMVLWPISHPAISQTLQLFLCVCVCVVCFESPWCCLGAILSSVLGGHPSSSQGDLLEAGWMTCKACA